MSLGTSAIMTLRPAEALRGYLVLSAAAAAALLVGLGNVVSGAEVRVDCSGQLGTIRALHGVNNGPVNYGQTIDLSAYYRELKIPLARLHDSEWPNPDVVDIHAVFPDLSSDPGLAENYRFSRTDDYIKAIVDTGARMVYRLGESIETTQKKYNVAPPSDYEKWTGACIGIIRHYNEGWADGFRYAIPYWEIWNEPENRPNMWTGSDEDYYRLYATAAKAIKARWPELKVGGPSIGAPGELVEAQDAEGERLKPTAFLQGFLDYCKKSSVPLDFFSWHTYCDNPYVFAQKARAVRRLLDEYGFTMTESHLNEWNYLPDNDWTPMSLSGQGLVRQRWYEKMGGAHGAAFVVCTLIYLQDSPVDVANFYSGDTNQFGLFNRYGAPKKTFYAMKAFVALLDTPVRVKASGGKPARRDASQRAGVWAGKPGDMAVCAGINQAGTEAAILVGNFRCEEKDLQLSIEHLPWRGDVRWEIFRLDSSHDLERVRSGTVAGDAQGLVGEIRLSESLEAPCVLLVRLHKTATPPGPKAGQAIGE